MCVCVCADAVLVYKGDTIEINELKYYVRAQTCVFFRELFFSYFRLVRNTYSKHFPPERTTT